MSLNAQQDSPDLRFTSQAQLAEQVAQFAEQHTPAKPRWEYALARTSHRRRLDDGRIITLLSERTFPVVARFLGVRQSRAAWWLRTMKREGGFEAAHAWLSRFNDDPLTVGTLEPWQIGHVYFARVADMPHVAKVGFSRRVAERIDDIETKTKSRLIVDTLKVGTLADEHWWHRNWRSLHISGEWFFWPQSSDRSLPAFLAQEREAA